MFFAAEPGLSPRRRAVLIATIAAAAVAVATALVALVESPPLSVPNAAPLYLLAVVVAGLAGGAVAAVLTAVASFVVYDLLFVEPQYTLVVEDPGEWLNLLLLLLVGLVIGRLTALQGERAADAARRARENAALFGISRTLATAERTEAALQAIVDQLVAETAMQRVWVSIGDGPAERVAADSDADARPARSRIQTILRRTPGDQPAVWVRAHEPGPRSDGPRAAARAAPYGDLFRVAILADGRVLGWLVAIRPTDAPKPAREETRILSLAADQIGLAIARERLASEAAAAEVARQVARQGEALKTALLESVSHDLRTPLASIRAAAGSLMDPDLHWTDDDRMQLAGAIDLEAERLNRVVRNLLDLSRIEAGALRPRIEPFDLAILVEPVVERLRPLLAAQAIDVEIDPDLPPVLVDAVHLDEAIANLLENAARHAPGASVRLVGRLEPDGRVLLRVEDAGPGVPAAQLGRLFERFARGESDDRRARRGLGLGLSVVRGLSEAMGAEVRAGRSELGGLAIDLVLPTASPVVRSSPVAAPS